MCVLKVNRTWLRHVRLLNRVEAALAFAFVPPPPTDPVIESDAEHSFPALDLLAVPDRRILQLLAYGATPTEVATILNIAEPAARRRISRAWSRLQALLFQDDIPGVGHEKRQGVE